jgi:hypothetical protein
MFMCSTIVSPYIPDEFWTGALEKALSDAIENFKKYEARINKEVYLDDFIRTLVSFGMRQISSRNFKTKVEDFLQPHVSSFGPKMSENMIFYLSRVESTNVSLLAQVIKRIEDNRFVEKGLFKD